MIILDKSKRNFVLLNRLILWRIISFHMALEFIPFVVFLFICNIYRIYSRFDIYFWSFNPTSYFVCSQPLIIEYRCIITIFYNIPDAKRNKYCKSSVKVILLVFVLTVKNNHHIQRETETIRDQFVNYGLNQLKIRIREIFPKLGIV